MAKQQRGFPTVESTAKSSVSSPSLMDRLQQRWHLLVTFLVIVIGGTVAWAWTAFGGLDVQDIQYEIVNTYPHDPKAFTQGLLFHEGYLYESTGQYGESNVRRVELETGKVLNSTPLGNQYFGEGLTMVGDQFYQVTWKAEKGFIYNKDLQPVKQFDYDGEGWGLVYDGQHLIMSDGTYALQFLNPENMKVENQVTVRFGQSLIQEINEMEYVDGAIYANKWKTDVIYRIDPRSGNVTGRIRLGNLLSPEERPKLEDDGSLNGIAYNPITDTFYITGKRWPKLFEIRLK